ncbi:MAG: CsgG/HfaB family protein [Leptospirales bacterium]|nr:CsgG/HfaB family protein [Leptospirales bacterium]
MMIRATAFRGIALLLATIGLLSSACSAVEVQVNNIVIESSEPLRVAILPFQIQGADWGREFADSLGLQLARSGRFVQVERGRELQRLLQEQRFNESGLIEDRTRVQIGRLTGARLIITGDGRAMKMRDSDGRMNENLIDTCTVRAIDVQTGEHVITLRKTPGRAWTAAFRAKYFLTLGFGWDLRDISIESAEYDEVARQFSQRIADHFPQVGVIEVIDRSLR